MRFEWEENKIIRNRRKHGGVSFELAALVFQDDDLLIDRDRVDEIGEQRWHAIGIAQIAPKPPAVLFVVHVYKEDWNGEEVVRIISARKANKNDIRRYKEQAVD